MFNAAEFSNITAACNHVKKTLSNLEIPRMMEFQVIYSISETECTENGGKCEEIGEILQSALHVLNAQQGYMIYERDEDAWNYLDWKEPDEEIDVYKPTDPDEIFVFANEGVVIIHNIFAVCENQFPIIIVKKSFWKEQQ